MPAEAPTIVAPPPGPSADEVAARAAQTTINVSSMPTSAEPSKPPKAGSARAKLFESMDKKFGGDETPPPSKPSRSAPKAEKTAAASPAKAESEPTATPPPAPSPGQEATKPAGEAAQATTTPPAATPASEPGKKVSPWKMVDEWKARATAAEKTILDLQKKIVPEEQARQAAETVKNLEAKMKEMAEDLRYHRAEKYDPDVLKANEEYTRTFNRAMTELKDVVVTDPQTQQPRALTVNDIAELAFMPLGQAQSVAKEVFGDLAPYVMDHRNEIRRMWDAKQAILENLKKNGAEREQQRTLESERAQSEMSGFIETTFKQANEEAAADPQHGRFFKPAEGDEEWNTRLQKGFAFVDEALATNVADPRLTKEQRADLVRKHAAIRNMSAAFRPLRYKLEATEKLLAQALEELKQYKETTPTTGGRSAEPPQDKPRGMAGVFSALDKIAH